MVHFLGSLLWFLTRESTISEREWDLQEVRGAWRMVLLQPKLLQDRHHASPFHSHPRRLSCAVSIRAG